MLSRTPFVSIISGYFNRAELLDRTIQSILSQTYTHFEFLIFDDYSQDNTKELLLKYKELNDPRLKIIIHEKNHGFVEGLINAIKMSKGEYIAIQSSGDISLPERILKQVKILNENPEVTVVGCHYMNIVETQGLSRIRKPSADNLDFDLLLRGNIFSHGEVMFRRSAYDLTGGYRSEFKFCQDYDLWLRMIKIGPFRVVPEILFERYIQFDGVSYDPKKAINQFKFNYLAKKLSVSPNDSSLILIKLNDQPIDNLISSNLPDIQKKILNYCLRDIAFSGSYTPIMAKNISSHFTRIIVLTAYQLFQKKPFSLLLSIVQKIVGVKKND